MKTVEDFAPNIPNASVFSRFNARSEFLQIKPNEQGLYLITLNNQTTKYMLFYMLSFIYSITEIFQQIMN